MANRRMFSLDIVDSDAFLDMPASSQNLYFHLGMRADDDGFVSSPKKIMGFCKASIDDFNILIAKKFLVVFDSGIVVIKAWKINNYIAKDRYKPTNYQEEMSQLTTEKNGSYTLCIQDVDRMYTECRQVVHAGKDSIGKYSISNKRHIVQNADADVPFKNENLDYFEQFWSAYPKKQGKDKCLRWFTSRKISEELISEILKSINDHKQTEQWQKESGKFIPMPYTFLTGGRWKDELEIDVTNCHEDKWVDDWYKNAASISNQ